VRVCTVLNGTFAAALCNALKGADPSENSRFYDTLHTRYIRFSDTLHTQLMGGSQRATEKVGHVYHVNLLSGGRNTF